MLKFEPTKQILNSTNLSTQPIINQLFDPKWYVAAGASLLLLGGIIGFFIGKNLVKQPSALVNANPPTIPPLSA